MQPRIRMTELTVIRILKITKTLPQHPYGWPKKGFPGPQGPYYCGVGANKVCLQFLQNNLWIFLIDFKLCLYFRFMAGRWWKPITAPASLLESTSLGQTLRSQDDDSEVNATLTEEKIFWETDDYMLSFEDATALHNHDIGSLLGDAGPMGVPGWSKKLLQN